MSAYRALRGIVVSHPLAIPCRRSLPTYARALEVRRLLSTSRPVRAALAAKASNTQESPARITSLLRSPSKKDIQDAEIDAELLSLQDAKLQVTDRAAERLRSISTNEDDPDVALRIMVESGGCHGYQYAMELTSKIEPEDYLFSHPSIKPSNLVVDAVSMPLIKGSTIDFATELIGSSFRINDNPQAKGSGCGCGVSWELKLD